MMRITSRLRFEDAHEQFGKENNKKKKKFSKAFKEMVASCLSQDPSKRPSADKLLRHPFFKNCKSPDYLVKNVLQVVPTVEERFKERGTAGGHCDEADGGGSAYPPVKNRRVSGWNFNEDVFKLDPIYPAESEDKCTIKCIELSGDELFHQSGHPDLASVKADGDQERNKESKVEDEESAKKGCEAAPPNSVILKESLVPNLVSLLSSLDMQREMVKDVLAHCGCEDGQEEVREQSEQHLLGYVRNLQQTVDDLNLQLQREMKRSAQLEEAVDRLKRGSGEEQKSTTTS